MKKIITLILLSTFFFSCKESSKQNEGRKDESDISKLEKVIIHFYPSFNLGSIIVWDVKNSHVVFQRLDSYKIRVKLMLKSTDPGEEMAPLTTFYQLDPVASTYLKDSIVFGKEDFVDRVEMKTDGMGNIITYFYDNGNIIDVDTNSPTENQKKMISYLLDLTLINTKDSLSQNYLSDLRKYY